MAVPIKGRTQKPQDAPDAQAAQPGLPSRRLAAIMFTDLVGYSALAHRDEALAIELLELHRGWVREILPRYAGQEIETIGDAFLVVFSGALAAVECAVALQQRFAEHNKAEPPARHMKLRVGIHLGDIEHRAGKVMGDGVNVASRIHGMAQPGGICVSEDVQRLVRNRAGLRFTSLGRPDLKNIHTPIELFEVHAGPDSLRNEVIAKARRTVDRVPRWLLYPVLAMAMVSFFSDDDERVPVGAVEPGAGVPTLPATPQPANGSTVMVPPFQDRGGAGEAMAEGLHRALVEQMGQQGLAVMSVATALSNPVAELEKLADNKVEHVLTGTVEQTGQRLRVAVQLIDTDGGAPVWSSEYERELVDLPAVQADIARSIATSVRAKLMRED